MRILLTRHAHAGNRDRWVGEDSLRPISERGRRQAEALPPLLVDQPIEHVISSPALRCVETVTPLATARGLTPETAGVLAEGTPLDQLLSWLAERDAPVALCSHADVIGAVIDALGPELPEPRWAKASTWVIEGDVTAPQLRYLAPPAG
jgi:broad specificity phosphatase PhoE